MSSVCWILDIIVWIESVEIATYQKYLEQRYSIQAIPFVHKDLLNECSIMLAKICISDLKLYYKDNRYTDEKYAIPNRVLLLIWFTFKLHCPPKVKIQSVLMLSRFAHYS